MFSKDILNKKQRYIFSEEDGMLYERVPAWVDIDNDKNNELYYEKHNALWRTALALIAYKDTPYKNIILNGVLRCFRRSKFKWNKTTYQACRCNPRLWEDDVSRDQVTMALVALEIATSGDASSEIASGLRYRLSKRYMMVPSMWFWVKWIATRNVMYRKIYEILFLIECILSTISTTIGVKYNLNKLILPAYGMHLSAWQMHIMPNSFLLKMCKILLTYQLDKLDSENLVLKKLLGNVVDIESLEKNWIPMNGFRWEIYINKTDRFVRKFTEDESVCNTIDKDILSYIKKI